MTVPLILVTRPDGERDPLVAALRAAGLRVIAVPTVATEAEPAGGPLDLALANATDWDWVIVTSARAAAALVAAVDRVGPAASLGEWPARWAAVGEQTAEALRQAGVRQVAVPAEERGVAIVDFLAARIDLRGQRILLPRAGGADRDLPDRLAAAGAIVHEVAAYATVIGPATSASGIAMALADPDLALGVVASGSAVAGLLALAEAAGPAAVIRARGLPLVSIGPVTSAAVHRHGLRLAAEAERPSVPALVDAVRGAVGRLPAGVAR